MSVNLRDRTGRETKREAITAFCRIRAGGLISNFCQKDGRLFGGECLIEAGAY